ncbi:MAG: hypothetical protein AABW83_02060 [Nanoarchaeota archaeon]
MVSVEEDNLKEEIKEEIKNALRDGIDNEGCAVFRVMRREQYSPKGKAIILDNGHYEKILYDCNLCGACGSNLCKTFQKARRVLVLKGKEVEENKKILENLEKSGNVYGEIDN